METREKWLLQATDILRVRHFRPVGYEVPEKVRVSVGFPKGGRAGGSHTIGQCWDARVSGDGHNEIFIHPELADPGRVMDVLTHELVHAAVGLEAGHKKVFKTCAIKVGLIGKMTATVASPELHQQLQNYLKRLPPYPHAAMVIGGGEGRPKQSTRLLKGLCPACGYTIRLTAKWADLGLPTCVCGRDMELDDE